MKNERLELKKNFYIYIFRFRRPILEKQIVETISVIFQTTGWIKYWFQEQFCRFYALCIWLPSLFTMLNLFRISSKLVSWFLIHTFKWYFVSTMNLRHDYTILYFEMNAFCNIARVILDGIALLSKYDTKL